MSKSTKIHLLYIGLDNLDFLSELARNHVKMRMHIYLLNVFLNLISNINHKKVLSVTFKFLVRLSLTMGKNNLESYTTLHPHLSLKRVHGKLQKGATLWALV